MALLKKLPQIDCVILVVKLHSSSAHHYAFSDYLSRVYVISSAKVVFSGKQEIWKMDRIIFFGFFLYALNQKV